MSSKDSLLFRTEIFPKQGSLHIAEADNFISTPSYTAEPIQCIQCLGARKPTPVTWVKERTLPAGLFETWARAHFSVLDQLRFSRMGLQLSQKAVTALKLLIYYYQQHVKRRPDNYGIISISAFLFSLIKINWSCLQHCSPKFEHT